MRYNPLMYILKNQAFRKLSTATITEGIAERMPVIDDVFKSRL